MTEQELQDKERKLQILEIKLEECSTSYEAWERRLRISESLMKEDSWKIEQYDELLLVIERAEVARVLADKPIGHKLQTIAQRLATILGAP